MLEKIIQEGKSNKVMLNFDSGTKMEQLKWISSSIIEFYRNHFLQPPIQITENDQTTRDAFIKYFVNPTAQISPNTKLAHKVHEISGIYIKENPFQFSIDKLIGYVTISEIISPKGNNSFNVEFSVRPIYKAKYDFQPNPGVSIDHAWNYKSFLNHTRSHEEKKEVILLSMNDVLFREMLYNPARNYIMQCILQKLDDKHISPFDYERNVQKSIGNSIGSKLFFPYLILLNDKVIKCYDEHTYEESAFRYSADDTLKMLDILMNPEQKPNEFRYIKPMTIIYNTREYNWAIEGLESQLKKDKTNLTKLKISLY